MAVLKRQKTVVSGPRVSMLTWVVVVLLILSLLYVAGSVFLRQEEQLQRVQARQAELDRERAAAEAAYQESREILDAMGSDYFIEKISREELGMLMPGEILFTD